MAGREFLLFALNVRAHLSASARQSQKAKTIPSPNRSATASRSDPFDPCHPKYPDEPSVLDAIQSVSTPVDVILCETSGSGGGGAASEITIASSSTFRPTIRSSSLRA